MESFIWGGPVLAYFDPGSGSLVLQAVVGGAAGLVVLAKYLWKTAAPSMFRRRPAPRDSDSSQSSCDMITVQSS